MNAKKKNKNTPDSDVGFNTFEKSFQLLSWKWMDKLISQSRYLLAAVLIVYAFAIVITYFPDNSWITPVQLNQKIAETTNPDEKHELERLSEKLDGRLLFLEQYKSMHLIVIAFICALVLIVRWRHLIPKFFQWLWNSQRLESLGSDKMREYMQFLEEYQMALKTRSAPALIGLILTGSSIWLALSNGMFKFFKLTLNPAACVGANLMFVIAVFFLFLLGQYSWALYTTSSYIGKLGQRFRFVIQPSHPDKCGGLKPLGNFCLENILPLVVISLLFLGISFFKLDVDTVSKEFATVYLYILAAPMTALTVFVPVWNIHVSMVESKNNYLDNLGSRLSELEEIIYAHTKENGDISKAKEANEKLGILRDVHPEKSSYPVWPFRITPTVLAIFSPQIIKGTVEITSIIYGIFS